MRGSLVKIVALSEELTVKAAKFKLKYYGKLSLADRCLIALAGRVKARIVTTDSDIGDIEGGWTIFIQV